MPTLMVEGKDTIICEICYEREDKHNNRCEAYIFLVAERERAEAAARKVDEYRQRAEALATWMAKHNDVCPLDDEGDALLAPFYDDALRVEQPRQDEPVHCHHPPHWKCSICDPPVMAEPEREGAE